MRRAVTISILSMAILAGAAAAAVAQEDRYLDGKIRTGDDISIGQDQVIDGDLYLFGGTVDIAGDVDGDLVVFAGRVTITGNVSGDVLAGTGTLDVDGEIGGDLRVGSGQASVSGVVDEDVLAGVGRLSVGGSVGGDVVFGAGQVTIAGDVAGDVLGEAGTYSSPGTVSGSERVTIDEPDEPSEQRSVVVRAILRFASLFLIGLLALWAGHRRLADRAAAIDRSPGPVLGWGLVFLAGLVVVPVATLLVGVILSIFFGWLGLGLLVGVSVIAIVATWVAVAVAGFLMIAVVAPVTVGTWAGGKALAQGTPAYLAMAAGVAGIVVIGYVPVLGPLVGLAVTLAGAGAWLRLTRDTGVDAGVPATASGQD